ncbi:hypothetical protein CEXT_764131 [Caerostris extrusa]|uniref:Uncharacterized protein n=1 Tax=Caerostris extrusa TaxID=172846 RepID=A0AAV4V328_CAEEX|nr:hypothetical protein CEXT_764131 [Caerostris extrusa]
MPKELYLCYEVFSSLTSFSQCQRDPQGGRQTEKILKACTRQTICTMLVEERTVFLRQHRKMQYFGWWKRITKLSTCALITEMNVSSSTVHML